MSLVSRQKKIVNVIDIGWNDKQDEIIVWAKDKDYKSYPIIEPILLQFTGLHDKNGKEIYEGDIVISNNNKFDVVFQEGGFYLSNGIGYLLRDYTFLTPKNERCEIIGNIFENPNLLK